MMNVSMINLHSLVLRWLYLILFIVFFSLISTVWEYISQQDNYSMLQLNGAGAEDDPVFKWGARRGVARKDSNVQFYESFTYEGIEYRLFDCAYFYVHGQCETSIGKLVNMYETSAGEKKVKVIWFFRPIDIHRFLGKYEPKWNELFLACGDEIGVSNINDVETILGKCKIKCISEDRRNPQPESSDLRRAKYVFSHTFDTRLKILSNVFADAIAGIGVEKFFNRIRDKQPVKRLNSSAATSSRASPVKSIHPDLGSTKLGKEDNRDGKLTSRTSSGRRVSFLDERADHVHAKKNPHVNTDTRSRGPITKTRAFGELHASGSSVDAMASKKRKRILNRPETDDCDDSGPQLGEKKFIKKPPLVEKAPNQNIKKSSWYKKLPFEEELKAAIEESRVLLIENLEPSYTSLEVEELCWQAFNEGVDAKMIPSSLMSSSHQGRALVIFGTTKAADSALSRLTEECLMLLGQTALVGSRNFPVEIGKCRSFTGHFSMLDRSMMTTQKRKAVSTSHCTQPNHAVDSMAYEWLALQAKSELTWKKLAEIQAKEIDILKRINQQ
ncbi:PREDICTED: protein ANTI-SILENCING 1-like [Camelina sativa]|uniref:Protein ANTI-SILENCING 1-like n=1 Tax=Camelina sativa TaxID=90675 RepID=A0ABM1RSR4_CAMSA|nr:PREDICTED: protein ANTI-SILENCING 1-like [Camelina sativa]